MTNQELNDLLNGMNTELAEVKSELRVKVNNSDFQVRLNNVYNNLLRQMKGDFNRFATDFTANHSSTVDNIYTKDEIDSKGFLTQHQSLDEYVTKEYAERNYLNVHDVHGLVLTDYAKTSDVNRKLENYVSNTKLELTLGDYATTEYVDSEIDKINTAINKKGEYATKKYVDSNYTNVLHYVDSKYITREYGSEIYFSNANQLNFADYVERTYATKEELSFAEHGILTTDVLNDYVKSSDMSDYATKDDVSFLSESISRANAIAMGNAKDISTLTTKINNTMSTDDLMKNYFNKTDSDNRYLTTKKAANLFLSIKSAQDDYLSKHEAKVTYLAIEDYKSLKGMISIIDTYRYDREKFEERLDLGELRDSIYIIGDTFEIVKNGYNISGNQRMDWTFKEDY